MACGWFLPVVARGSHSRSMNARHVRDCVLIMIQQSHLFHLLLFPILTLFHSFGWQNFCRPYWFCIRVPTNPTVVRQCEFDIQAWFIATILLRIRLVGIEFQFPICDFCVAKVHWVHLRPIDREAVLLPSAIRQVPPWELPFHSVAHWFHKLVPDVFF